MNPLHIVDWLKNFAGLLPWIGLMLLLIFIIAWVTKGIVRILNIRHIFHESYTIFELTPPAFDDRTPQATQELFAVLHGLGSSKPFLDRLLRRDSVVSLEIVSTREHGIRFLARVPDDQATVFKHTIHAYLPDVKVRKTEDYVANLNSAKTVTFRQKEHFAYPLHEVDSLSAHDPIAYLANTMTQLEPEELMAFQLVAVPVKVAEAYTLGNKILTNEDVRAHLHNSSRKSVGGLVIKSIGNILSAITNTITYMNHGASNDGNQMLQRDLYHQKQVIQGVKPARTISKFEQELIESIHHKLSQPLFRVEIRAAIKVNSSAEMKQRLHGVVSALSSYSVAKYQALEIKRVRTKRMRQLQHFSFVNRMPETLTKNSNILAASEVSSLFHFPHSIGAKTENVVKSLSKTLPAPVSLKNGAKLDIVLGENQHHGSVTPVGLSLAERERHVYIIGGTGNGKTTMLLFGIMQDINSGKGLAVLDPHGDLAETILHHLPKERIKDVIYLNPDDLAHPIGVNLLELDPSLTGDELLREKDLITESTISVLRKIFSEDDSGGHRIEYVLRNSIQTALTLEGATLFTIFRLLNDAKFRRNTVKNLEDEDLKNFWSNELGKAGEFQRVKMSAGITAKIGRFLFSASAKRILEQEKSTIDFDNILDSGKILICNFSKGLLGEDTSALFGTTVLAKLQVAALRRARQKQSGRQPFFLYVDEFQNFATMSFVQMLSEARKYKLYLTMAEQSTSQQDQQRLVDIILANVGTVICFRSGSPSDERLILPLFNRYLEQGEIANLPAYSFYARIAAVNAQEPMSGVTVLLDSEGSGEVANAAINHSRKEYGIKVQPEKPMKPKDELTLVKKTNATKRQSKEPDLALIK